MWRWKHCSPNGDIDDDNSDVAASIGGLRTMYGSVLPQIGGSTAVFGNNTPTMISVIFEISYYD